MHPRPWGPNRNNQWRLLRPGGVANASSLWKGYGLTNSIGMSTVGLGNSSVARLHLHPANFLRQLCCPNSGAAPHSQQPPASKYQIQVKKGFLHIAGGKKGFLDQRGISKWDWNPVWGGGTQVPPHCITGHMVMAHMVPHDTMEPPEALRAPLSEFHRRRAHIAQPILLICTFFLLLKPVTSSPGNGARALGQDSRAQPTQFQDMRADRWILCTSLLSSRQLCEVHFFIWDFWALEMT